MDNIADADFIEFKRKILARIREFYYLLGHKADRIEHVERVCDWCDKFSSFLPVYLRRELDLKLLLISSAYHDIAKVPYKKTREQEKKDKKHHLRKNVEQALRNCDVRESELLFYEDMGVYDVIEVHKSTFCPQKKYVLEAAVLRMCDKLDKLYQKKQNAEFGYLSSKNAIEMFFRENDMDWDCLNNYLQFCEKHMNIKKPKKRILKV